MIDFQRAVVRRRLLRTFHQNSLGLPLVPSRLGDAAREMSLSTDEAADLLEGLRRRGLVSVAPAEPIDDTRVWITARGIEVCER